MKRIVFYAETSADWAFLHPIVESLKFLNEDVIRITSDPEDKLLKLPNVYYIGLGSTRTILFRTIKTEAFVMTLTDLGSFYLKKSLYPVHYFYIFHSLVSTHRVYREHAFDAYDTILCAGDYQIKEIRKTEEVYGLSKKSLAKHGYGRLDNLIIEKNKKNFLNKNKQIFTNVLLAPSWGKGSLANQHLDRLIEILIAANFRVTLRLHPMTQRHYPNLSNILNKKYEISGKYFFDPHIENVDSLIDNHIMISDWSGASIEFSFATERPVIFVDTEPKINNLNWKKIDLPCLEETIRKEIGSIVSEHELETIPNIILKLLQEQEFWSDKIRKIRNKTVFNIGISGKIGAKIILKKINLKNN